MEGSDKSRISTRLQELVRIHGKHWGIIAEIMEKEEFREKGEPLSSNALRKRYRKLGETGALISDSPPVASEPVSTSSHAKGAGELDFDGMQKSRMESALERFEGAGTLPAVSSENSMTSSIESLMTMNRQLLEEIQHSHRAIERLAERLDEQEQKTTHTGNDTGEQPVTTRDLLELLKEVTSGRLQMMHIEEERKHYIEREEVQQLIEESVEDRIDAELKTMLAEDGSFSKEIAGMIDQRLRALFSGGEPVVKTAHAGPGRGKRGKTHKKFSASLEEGLFERVRSLPGQFSGHLSNALDAYLSVMEDQKAD